MSKIIEFPRKHKSFRDSLIHLREYTQTYLLDLLKERINKMQAKAPVNNLLSLPLWPKLSSDDGPDEDPEDIA